jgi:hypothetical protein
VLFCLFAWILGSDAGGLGKPFNMLVSACVGNHMGKARVRARCADRSFMLQIDDRTDDRTGGYVYERRLETTRF